MDNLSEDIMEIWKQIAGYEGTYSVSSMGRLRIDKAGKGCRVGRIFRPSKNSSGYYITRLTDSGNKKPFRVHNLVALAFLGVRPDGYDINHIDGNKENNNADNLEYVTRSENVKHAFRLGLMKSACGEDSGQAKLTDEDVLEIRRIYSSENCTKMELAKRFGVSDVQIFRIVNNRAWKHLLNTSA